MIQSNFLLFFDVIIFIYNIHQLITFFQFVQLLVRITKSYRGMLLPSFLKKFPIVFLCLPHQKGKIHLRQGELAALHLSQGEVAVLYFEVNCSFCSGFYLGKKVDHKMQ